MSWTEREMYMTKTWCNIYIAATVLTDKGQTQKIKL